MSLTGIILSGGESSRMGMEKGLCILKGKPLIEYSFDLLKNICDSIIISANIKDYDYLGCPVIKDEVLKKGPASGIYSCLKASKTNDNFVISCDMPMLTAELIRYILSNKGDFDVVVPLFKGLPEPLSAYYRKNCTSVFEESINSGKYKIQDIIKNLSYRYIPIEPSETFYNSCLFTNVNTPDDHQKLDKMMSKNPTCRE